MSNRDSPTGRRLSGTVLQRCARFSIDDDERHSPVISAPEGNHLLGASALEIFNLVVDPAGKKLLPAAWLSLG